MRRTLSIAAALLAAFAALSFPAWGQSPHTHRHSFGGAEHWAQYFDDPQRDEWQKPHEVIHALALRPDAIVADIGAGTGYFTVRLAHMLPRGTVYAVDTEPDMVRYLAERAKREKLGNVVPVQAEPGNAELPRKVDLVLMVDVYHHIDSRPEYFRKLAGSLAENGRVAIIDFRLDAPMGPPRDQRVPPQQIESEMKSAGYALVQSHTFLPRQHFLVFRRATGQK